MDKNLVKAVVEQLDCDDGELRNTLKDVTEHGADAGFSGFIYYNETCDFYKRNQKAIADEVEELAQGLGEDPTEMVKGFNCLRGQGYTTKEVALTLYGTPSQHNDIIANALAWFALEEVAHHKIDS
jgi:hypothetical protein